MAAVRNLLFVMCDQLRRDHLSCYGGRVPTPNIDALAARGVRFEHAYVQSGVCGPSRMSYYTGRYVSSHGATWNRVPLSLTQPTLGDYLARAGRFIALAGKSHAMRDEAGIARFAVDEATPHGRRLVADGFVEVDRYDGHTPPGPESGYGDFLRAHGYASDDPWTDFAIAAMDGDRVASGWHMRNVHLPSRVAEAHSETAYMTDVALDWIRAQGESPWALHLSYVKPHWPYVAPAPYHAMFRGAGVALGPIVHGPQDGTADEHPVVAAYRTHDESVSMGREEVARHVRPAYMGLVAQVDAHVGRLVGALRAAGRLQDTLIVLTSDHGEFLGDRGLGEKELFYDEVVRVPLIVVDPDPRADATRGNVEARMVEAVDLVPTFVDALGVAGSTYCDGRSLLPLLRGGATAWRDDVLCELDYGFRRARLALGRGPAECRGFMVRTCDWKYVHWEGLRPQLFDLAGDPLELADLGADPRLDAVRRAMRERLMDRLATLRHRVTLDDAEILARTDNHRTRGVHIGIW
ncbi:MAG: sulfatase-like hydrolase/transferase [Burkholderiales bacterium]